MMNMDRTLGHTAHPWRMASLVTALVLPWTLAAQEFVFRYPYVAGSTADHYSAKYGWSIAADEERVVVGSPFANNDAGEVRVYPTAGILSFTDVSPQVLTEQDAPESTRKFGATVAVDATFIAVGNCSAQGGSEYCGINAPWVSIFSYDGVMWTQTQRIIRPAHASGRFGVAIAISGDWLAVGGARTGTQQDHVEKVYLYRRAGDTFNAFPGDSLQGVPCAGPATDAFGHALAMDPEHLIVGASSDDELGTDAGAAYVYANNGSGVTFGPLIRKLLPSDGDAHDLFGFSIALRGDVCVAGAPEKDQAGAPTGAAYVFDRNEGFPDNWGQVSLLSPELPGQPMDMQFGASVAISEARIAVGAPQDSLGTADLQGSITLFAEQAGDWNRVQTIRPRFDGPVNDVSRSGSTLAFAFESLLIGAPWAIVNGGSTFPTGGMLIYADPLLDVSERSARASRIWPVPATDHLMILVHRSDPALLRTLVRDVMGRVLMDIWAVHGANPVRLEIDPLPPGLYSVEVVAPEPGGTIRSMFIHQ